MMASPTCTTGVEHVLDPDSNLCCKLRYWRQGEGMKVAFGSVNGVFQGPAGRKAFHGDHADGGTIGERREKMIADARANGYEPVPVGHRTYTGR